MKTKEKNDFAPWLNGQPDYAGWVGTYEGKTWGEACDTLHPPTEEGRQAAEDEGQSWTDYYASKTDDEDYIETLHYGAAEVDLENDLILCDCCDWGWPYEDEDQT